MPCFDRVKTVQAILLNPKQTSVMKEEHQLNPVNPALTARKIVVEDLVVN
ncbi:MAG: hypothetical protein KDD02_20935 [Phaeodactylibacter sp.]|nr:hypothetical protein [Phaeodactylibacter sp.]MCB9299214.1 hypothetical protein [Lewinellaceae bacterium]HQU61187.1 hypothetical protein [Saprospiraceae bacterium]